MTPDGIEHIFDAMVHHWRPSDLLEQTLTPGEWAMYDRGVLLGRIQYGRAGGRPILRGMTPQGDLLGYAPTLEEASDRLWSWAARRRTGSEPGDAPPPECRSAL